MSGDKPLTPEVIAAPVTETAQEAAPRENEAAETAAPSTAAAADAVTRQGAEEATAAPSETAAETPAEPVLAADAASSPDAASLSAAASAPNAEAEPEAAPEALADGQPPLPPIPPDAPTQSPAAEPENLPTQSESAPPATPKEDEEEPDDRPMGLMDHLAELRGRLVRCCIAVMVGFFACWAVVDPIFDALVAPLLSVLPEGSHAIYTTLPEGFFTRMQCGVNVPALEHLARLSTAPVIAAGGVATLADVQKLFPLTKTTNLVGAVSGRALYEGTLNLEEANAWIEAQ